MAKEEKTLDEMFQELDKLIQAMEEPEVSLEDSFQMYHQGIDMLKACNDKMDKIEKQKNIYKISISSFYCSHVFILLQ